VAETGEPGGASRRILDLQPTAIHQRKPIILGCKRDAEAVLKVSGWGSGWAARGRGRGVW
jgi:fructose-1,6-bisphosphatase